MAAFLPALTAGLGATSAGVGLYNQITGRGQQAVPGPDLSPLYLSRLGPGQTQMTVEAQKLAALTGPYLNTLNTGLDLNAYQAFSQMDEAARKAAAQTQFIAGRAGLAQSNILGRENDAAKYKTATEFLGPSTAAAMTNMYGQAAASLQNTVLAGESSGYNKMTEGALQFGLTAQAARNNMMLNQQKTNLEIARAREATKNQQSLLRGQTEAQMALKRMGAGMALAGQAAFA
jgi:hypothetical protein